MKDIIVSHSSFNLTKEIEDDNMALDLIKEKMPSHIFISSIGNLVMHMVVYNFHCQKCGLNACMSFDANFDKDNQCNISVLGNNAEPTCDEVLMNSALE